MAGKAKSGFRQAPDPSWGLTVTTNCPVIPVPMSVFVLISSVLPQATDILDKAGNVSG